MDKFLKPCPFCGAKARFMMSEYNDMSFVTAMCSNDRTCCAQMECPVASVRHGRASEEHLAWVMQRWNGRANV